MKRSPLKRKVALKTRIRKGTKRRATAKTRNLDSLVSKVVRSCGECLACGHKWNGRIYECCSRLECAHLKSRRHKAIRFSFDNVVCLCSVHHRFFTEHPDEWTKFIEKRFPGRWDHLNQLLLENDGRNVDYPIFFDYWTAEARRLGVEL